MTHVANSALNSIMFLLIHKKYTVTKVQTNNFKFHYVSINSFLCDSLLVCLVTLNSIMFLLIQLLPAVALFHIPTLNSIMFLLIRLLYALSPRLILIFKFHYVSINSVCTLFYSSLHFL